MRAGTGSSPAARRIAVELPDHRGRRAFDETLHVVGSRTARVDEQEQVPVLVDQLERGPHGGGERCPPWRARGDGTVDHLVEPVDEDLRQGDDERVLVAEVAIHDRLADTGRVGHFVHRDVGALRANQRDRGGDHPGAVGDRRPRRRPARSAPYRSRLGRRWIGGHEVTVASLSGALPAEQTLFYAR